MFGFVAVHDDSALGLQLPGALVDVEYDDVHAQVQPGFLRAEARAQAGVKEYHQEGFVPPQFHVFETVFLDFESFIERPLQVADVLHTCKFLHNDMFSV